MRHPVAIENIQAMRRQAGIEDLELREALRGLRIGDLVRLTLLTGTTPSAGETLRVRITRIRGDEFRGKLADRPVAPALSQLRAGSPVAFTAAHIHSLGKRRSAPGGRRCRPQDRVRRCRPVRYRRGRAG